jgi:NAD(P)-dependent dehydrogenase (short-subunit alcohol dehydrogenase family)
MPSSSFQDDPAIAGADYTLVYYWRATVKGVPAPARLERRRYRVHSLKGETALVTGAGRGIGRAIALTLSAAGAKVALIARTANDIQQVAQDIRRGGGEALAVAMDVTDPNAVRSVVEETEKAFGALSILVNNAGVPGPYGPIDVVDPSQWWAAQTINVMGPLLFMNAVIPAMRRLQRGRVINIVSNAGLQPVPHLSAYAVSKSTLIRLTETADLELRSTSVRVFALHPGNIRTDMARGTLASPEAQRWLADGLAVIRDRTPEESDADLERCREAVLALASGGHDSLGGRYLDIYDAALAAQAQTAPPR